MSNLTSIAGGAVWMAVSALLTVAALEPVDLKTGKAAVEIAQSCAATACVDGRA